MATRLSAHRRRSLAAAFAAAFGGLAACAPRGLTAARGSSGAVAAHTGAAPPEETREEAREDAPQQKPPPAMPATEVPLDSPDAPLCPLMGVDGAGTLYPVRGGRLRATGAGGEPLWVHDFPPGTRVAALAGDPEGGGVTALVVGDGPRPVGPQLVRLSASGEVLWKRALGALRTASASLAAGPAGAVALLGVDPGTGHLVLTVLDARGDLAFTRSWAGPDSGQVVFTRQGHLAVARHAARDIRFAWLGPHGEPLAEHLWGITATSFLVQPDDGDTLVAVANAPHAQGSPAAWMAHEYMEVVEPVFLRISPNGHVDYQLIPEQHLHGFVDIARVDAMAVDRQGNVWFQGNMTDSFGLGPFVTVNKGLHTNDDDDIGDAICGRFLAVLDRGGEPVWAHALANLVPCDRRPVGLLAAAAGPVLVEFNHRGDVALHVRREAPVAHAREACRLLRFTALPPFQLSDNEPPALQDTPDTGRHIGVQVDGHNVP